MAVYVSSKVILNSKEVLRIFIIESSRLYMSPYITSRVHQVGYSRGDPMGESMAVLLNERV